MRVWAWPLGAAAKLQVAHSKFIASPDDFVGDVSRCLQQGTSAAAEAPSTESLVDWHAEIMTNWTALLT